MLNINFIDTVVDAEKIVIDYDNVKQLQLDLKNIGSKVMKDPNKLSSLSAKKANEIDVRRI